jgi:retron-type reverse transcriptase
MQHVNMEFLSDLAHLDRAWQSVRQKGNTAGVDGQTPTMFQAGAHEALRQLQAELRDGSWQPRAGRRIELANDPERPIVVPTVRDRIVQRAIVDGLGPQ